MFKMLWPEVPRLWPILPLNRAAGFKAPDPVELILVQEALLGQADLQRQCRLQAKATNRPFRRGVDLRGAVGSERSNAGACFLEFVFRKWSERMKQVI